MRKNPHNGQSFKPAEKWTKARIDTDSWGVANGPAKVFRNLEERRPKYQGQGGLNQKLVDGHMRVDTKHEDLHSIAY